jgi:phosphatidylserine/phosphatidylglycerophosphate/cardiolipin synthase-like enzyme
MRTLDGPDDFNRVMPALGPNVDWKAVSALQSAWKAAPNISPEALAGGFLGAAASAGLVRGASRAEIVWTGPRTSLIPVRRTEQVLQSVIDGAENRVFLVSFVFCGITSLTNAMNRAVERGVHIDVLLEAPKDHGGNVSVDGVTALLASVPDACLYVWDAQQKTIAAGSTFASVHAKCAVADGEVALITSANLTNAAMSRNMELGVLLTGGTEPKRLQDHLEALVQTKAVRQWKEIP